MSRRVKKKTDSARSRRLSDSSHAIWKQLKVLVVIPVLLTTAVTGAYWGWQLVQRQGLTGDEYLIGLHDISITRPPAWITAEVFKAEVFRDASLVGPLSVLDAKITERIALAFSAHPWVADVRVEKFHPARIEVAIDYRQPVAVVGLADDLQPVDRAGVLLPRKDFSTTQLNQFARIHGVQSRRGAAGMPWGDARVLGAARIAAAFGSQWHVYLVDRIVPSEKPVRGARDVFTYQLVTKNGTVIDWGPQYLEKDHPREPNATAKIQRLQAYVQRYGTLDGVSLRQVTEGERTANSASPHGS